MIGHALTAALLLAASAQATRLPPRSPPPSASEAAVPVRVPIDLGPDAPSAAPTEPIDILAPPPVSEAATAAAIKECADRRDVGIVAGEIVVCRNVGADTSQLYSGTREAWLKDYAERTQNAGTIAPPDVAGPGIFRGPASIGGLCFIGPCPDEPALIIDVEAIPLPPEGSDAERVAQGLVPLEGDDAPLSDDSRQRLESELGLPEAEAAPEG